VNQSLEPVKEAANGMKFGNFFKYSIQF